MLRKMRLIFGVGFTVLALNAMAGDSGQGKKLTAQQIYQKYSKYVVTVIAGDETGTGFIDKYRRIFTCYHVIEGAKSIKIRFYDGREINTSNVTALDKSKDIVQLDAFDISDQAGTAYFFSSGKNDEGPPELGDFAGVETGEKLVVLGSPKGLDGSITEGLVSSKRQIEGADYIQLSAPISAGSSGSPVFGESGTVIGMVGKELTTGSGVGFAISSKDLKGVTGIPLSLVASDGQSERKSMLQQAIASDRGYERKLRHILAMSVDIESIDDDPGFKLKDSNMREPIEKMCKDLKIHILSEEDTHSLLKAKGDTDEEDFLIQDALRCQLQLIWLVRDEGDKKVASITLSLQRGALLSSLEFFSTEVYMDFADEEIKKGEDPGEVIKRCTQKLIDGFKEQFELDNRID